MALHHLKMETKLILASPRQTNVSHAHKFAKWNITLLYTKQHMSICMFTHCSHMIEFSWIVTLKCGNFCFAQVGNTRSFLSRLYCGPTFSTKSLSKWSCFLSPISFGPIMIIRAPTYLSKNQRYFFCRQIKILSSWFDR